ncbi:SDR family NAD(P)-dependent oxidoreductase [Tabrizicola sp.]|uniref:SDR family NAD(P)-dependent oxidoreductase n=1 Tax=Tabrizicola sp. TaxID=2005166 RepID=UPI003F3B0F4B
MKQIVVAGASRGLGAAVAQHYVATGEKVISLSRSPSPHGSWIRCDLADPSQVEAAVVAISGKLDVLVVVAGIWEDLAFSPDYSFTASPAEEISRILTVNLQAPILLAKALLPRLGGGGRIVLIGSTSGLDQIGTPEVAYNASKAGLRGASQALAQALKGQGITVSILNPGDIGTDGVLAAKRDGTMRGGGSLPMADLLSAIDFLLTLSPEASFCEISLIPLNG